MPVESEATASGNATSEGIDRPEKPTRRRKGGPRERSGCVTCRNRKKKCDGGFPICEQCRRLNYSCLREEPRSHIPANAHTWKTPPKSLTSNGESSPGSDTPLHRSIDASGMHVDSAMSSELVRHRKEIMRYYIQDFSKMLTTNHENNCFLSVFLPMAMDSPTLQNAILAWSCSHLSLQDEKYKRTALQFRGVSLNSLSAALSTRVGEPDLETSLAACLVLCSMEVILGDTAQWYQHLSGAFEVIRSTSAVDVGQDKSPLVPTGFLASTDGRWLLRNFAYHDIMMSVTCGRRPLLPGFYWANQDESIPDSYFGLASGLMYLISEISVLNSDMAEFPNFVNVLDVRAPQKVDKNLVANFFDEEFYIPSGPANTTSTFSIRAHQLESQLLSWQCASSKEPTLIALAEAYRAAALIHLYRTLRLHLPDLTPTLEFKISQVVQTMIECLETMPAGCLPECTLLFPLFMAGGEARNLDHIRIIRQRLVDVLESRHFRNVKAALEVLDEVWKVRAGFREDGPANVDWSDILKRKGWKLALT